MGEWLHIIDTLSKNIFKDIGKQDFTLGEWTFTHSKSCAGYCPLIFFSLYWGSHILCWAITTTSEVAFPQTHMQYTFPFTTFLTHFYA